MFYSGSLNGKIQNRYIDGQYTVTKWEDGYMEVSGIAQIGAQTGYGVVRFPEKFKTSDSIIVELTPKYNSNSQVFDVSAQVTTESMNVYAKQQNGNAIYGVQVYFVARGWYK